MSIDDLGLGVSWREATLLLAVLLRDPAAWVCAARQGWSYPVSREWIVAAHTYDLHAQVNARKGSKPKPYPNPFPDRNASRYGRTTLSPDEARAALARMNPKEPNG